AKSVARHGVCQLGDGANIACDKRLDRLLGLAPDNEELADPFVAVLVRVPNVTVGLEGAGENAEESELPDIGVRGCLEDLRGERSAGVGTYLDFVSGTISCFHSCLVWR